MKLTSTQMHLRSALMGLLMGLTLSFVGFTNFGEVNKMFLFTDLRMLFAFAGAVVFATLFFRYLVEGMPSHRKLMHPGIIPGAFLFGAGWAITGSCPSIALVQLGEGQVVAVFTAIGILLGVWLYRHVHRRFFRWDSGSCS